MDNLNLKGSTFFIKPVYSIKLIYATIYAIPRATGAVGSAAFVAQLVRGQNEGRSCPFYKNFTSKYACYSHEFKLKTVFLSNFAQVLT